MMICFIVTINKSIFIIIKDLNYNMTEYKIGEFILITDRKRPDLNKVEIIKFKKGEYLHIVIKEENNYYNLICERTDIENRYNIRHINPMPSKFFK